MAKPCAAPLAGLTPPGVGPALIWGFDLAGRHEAAGQPALAGFSLSAEEFAASGDRMFSRLDTSGDGLVDTADTASSF